MRGRMWIKGVSLSGNQRARVPTHLLTSKPTHILVMDQTSLGQTDHTSFAVVRFGKELNFWVGACQNQCCPQSNLIYKHVLTLTSHPPHIKNSGWQPYFWKTKEFIMFNPFYTSISHSELRTTKFPNVTMLEINPEIKTSYRILVN